LGLSKEPKIRRFVESSSGALERAEVLKIANTILFIIGGVGNKYNLLIFLKSGKNGSMKSIKLYILY